MHRILVRRVRVDWRQADGKRRSSWYDVPNGTVPELLSRASKLFRRDHGWGVQVVQVDLTPGKSQ